MPDQSHWKKIRQNVGENVCRCVGKVECRDVDALRVRNALVPCCSDGTALEYTDKYIGSRGNRTDCHDDECHSAEDPVSEPCV